MSAQTVRNRLHAVNLHAYRSAMCPILMRLEQMGRRSCDLAAAVTGVLYSSQISRDSV